MYKLDIQLKNGTSIKRELDEAGLRSFIAKRRFETPLLYANVITPSGVTKSILSYLK